MPVDRSIWAAPAIVVILFAAGLVPIGVILCIVGFGNMFNGEQYLKSPGTYQVAALGCGVLLVAGGLAFCGWRMLKRSELLKSLRLRLKS